MSHQVQGHLNVGAAADGAGQLQLKALRQGRANQQQGRYKLAANVAADAQLPAELPKVRTYGQGG
nr:hypothetical protein [Cesiribacter andamanensis]